MSSEDWKPVREAARLIGKRRPVTVYEYLRKPEVETGIRRMTVGKSTMVHIPTLRAFEATVKIGRPRKVAQKESPQHERTTPDT